MLSETSEIRLSGPAICQPVTDGARTGLVSRLALVNFLKFVLRYLWILVQ